MIALLLPHLIQRSKRFQSEVDACEATVHNVYKPGVVNSLGLYTRSIGIVGQRIVKDVLYRRYV